MKIQSVEVKKSEIAFRKKLIQQHIEGKNVLKDEFDAAAIIKILAERIDRTRQDMLGLRQRGIPLSPFVELGAERGQRSLLMENEFDARGIAVDLSFDMLKSCDHYKEVFHNEKIPFRICTDGNALPFLSNSVPFFFLYETLHHFPSPVPVVKEIHRVIAPGGTFFFDEEPFKNILHMNLYTKGKNHSEKVRHESNLRKVFDHFFAKSTCNEVEHGVIENDDIPMSDWVEAFNLFAEKEVHLHSVRLIHTTMYPRKNFLLYPLAYLLGGRISATCRKTGTLSNISVSIYNLLMCPECKEKGNESGLEQKASSFKCKRCNLSYPVYEGVLLLLSTGKFQELYPDIYAKTSH
jgi:SAM-dependent methyltransferase/uncharacterized protein YbaR (Trm112 family)